MAPHRGIPPWRNERARMEHPRLGFGIYSVRLNSGTASASDTTAKIER
jgi:hypothetical protein